LSGGASPSNEFFFGFSNTLLFETAGEFLLQLRHALTHRPQPLSAEERRRLSWEGATERFLDAVTDSTLGNTLPSLSEHTTRWLHAGLQKGARPTHRRARGRTCACGRAPSASRRLRSGSASQCVAAAAVQAV
jgi:digalactosyldiacylglycerol synthase